MMKTHIVFTLFDGSEHDTIEKAMNHCDEMMGAELRGFVNDINPSQTYLYSTMLKIVSDKKYDKEFFAYVEWRKEKDLLERYENNTTLIQFDSGIIIGQF